MTGAIYDNRYASCDGYPTDAGDIGVALKFADALTGHRADADGVRLFGTNIADMNIVIAQSENTRRIVQCDVVLTGGVILQCKKTNGGVFAAGCVGIERPKTKGRVSGAGCEVEEGIIACRGVLTGIASNRWGLIACVAGESPNQTSVTKAIRVAVFS